MKEKGEKSFCQEVHMMKLSAKAYYIPFYVKDDWLVEISELVLTQLHKQKKTLYH